MAQIITSQTYWLWSQSIRGIDCDAVWSLKDPWELIMQLIIYCMMP